MFVDFKGVIEKLYASNKHIRDKMEKDESYRNMLGAYSDGFALMEPVICASRIQIFSKAEWNCFVDIIPSTSLLHNLVFNPLKENLIFAVTMSLMSANACIIDEDFHTSLVLGYPLTPTVFKLYKSLVPDLTERFSLEMCVPSEGKDTDVINLNTDTILGETYINKQHLSTRFMDSYTAYLQLLSDYNYKAFMHHKKESARILNMISTLSFSYTLEGNKKKENNFVRID